VSLTDFSIARLRRVQKLAELASLAFSLLLPAIASACLYASGRGPFALTRTVAAQSDATIQNRPAESLARDFSAALSAGEEKRVQEVLDEILKRPQLNPDFLIAVGDQLAEHDRYADAALAFARCVRDHPAVFEGHYNLALAEFAEGKLTEALATLNAAPHNSAAQKLAILYLRGKVEYGLGDRVNAERDLTTAFSGAPRQENYALDLGLFYLQQHSYDRAAAVFERGASFNPKSPFFLLGCSLAQFLGGREAQALLSAEKLLKIQPDFSPAYLLAAYVLNVNGNVEDAEKLAARGLALPHPMAYLYYLHAALLVKVQSREYGRILDELTVANRELSRCELCSLTASKVHEAQGNFAAAIADLEEAMRFAPDFADAWYRLASLYERVGRKAYAAQARQEFERLKAVKEDREREMLQKVFLQTLSGKEQPASMQ